MLRTALETSDDLTSLRVKSSEGWFPPAEKRVEEIFWALERKARKEGLMWTAEPGAGAYCEPCWTTSACRDELNWENDPEPGAKTWATSSVEASVGDCGLKGNLASTGAIWAQKALAPPPAALAGAWAARFLADWMGASRRAKLVLSMLPEGSGRKLLRRFSAACSAVTAAWITGAAAAGSLALVALRVRFLTAASMACRDWMYA